MANSPTNSRGFIRYNAFFVYPDTRTYIARFEKLAYGMFSHWGFYTQLERGNWVQHTESIKNATWLDSQQPLQYAQNPKNGLATFDLTGYHYGSNLVIPIAKNEIDA